MSNQHHGSQHPHEHGHSAALALDILPAGAKDSHKPGHHGHTIVPLRLLVGVLVILLVFTVLTVSAANAEEWYSRTFDVAIPGWVNAVVALSIACVKSVIVALYFMQLRYDQNPMNALVCVFTIMVATFFLGFIAIDLGSRGIIYEHKAEAITPGGIGGFSRGSGDNQDQIPAGTPIAIHARERADKSIEQSLSDGKPITKHAYLVRLYNVYHELVASHELSENDKAKAALMKAYMDRNKAEFDEIAAYAASHSHGHAAGHGAGARNTANFSRSRTGITLTELGAPTDGHNAVPQEAGKETPASPVPSH